MNAVEIEQAVSDLFAEPLDREEFPYAFLQAFGNKETTLRKLRTGDTNKSDVGGVLQRNNLHLLVAAPGKVDEALAALRDSPATAKHKVKFILATDGEWLEAENLSGGAPLACEFARLPDYFGFFLPLAGISTVREIVENAFDIRATSKLNRLYVELLKENPEWGTDARRPDMNHFMARLIFSFFAEDTGIFAEDGLFTATISQMSERDSSNTHEVIATLFQSMNTRHPEREAAGLPRWAAKFPYVNGGLFSGDLEVPRFTRTARSYLLQVGSLDWKQINPDIFGSMIQAVADDEERGALGMHYTSVPNILKVLNPLFLDDLRVKLEEAGRNPRKLLNLRNRIKRIRVFDPACGSGNFLVIAYKEMRAVEQEINKRRGEGGRPTEIPLTNFRGIELRDFAAEIARLALIIAEFQCDVLYRGQKEALHDFLPLDAESWITCGNALRLDWLAICPPTGTSVKLVGDDLFSTPLDQSEIDFENAGGETYICGNPPYKGSQTQTMEQKSELADIFRSFGVSPRQVDYVGGWFMKAAGYVTHTPSTAAFVTTNSLCQGRSVPAVWPILLRDGVFIPFAHTSFRWSNLAAHNAGVTVAIVGLATDNSRLRKIFSLDEKGITTVEVARNINAYLVSADDIYVSARSAPLSALAAMTFGNQPIDGGHFTVTAGEKDKILDAGATFQKMVRPYAGSREFINGIVRECLWIAPEDEQLAQGNPTIAHKVHAVARFRRDSDRAETVALAMQPFQFAYRPHVDGLPVVVVPSVSSESRPYLPVGLCAPGTIISNLAFALYDAALWSMALIASRLHWVWIATVCGKLKTDFRYSNTLGWNTFPVPPLTKQNQADLTQCAEEILLAREAHYPKTIAQMYHPDAMPANLREAHERNDETLERIYVGRRFRNDTERLEKLFELYTKMTAIQQRPVRARGRRQTG